MLANEGLFDWGLARPLEKVIEGPEHLRLLLEMPELYRQSVAIVEPWANVGINPLGESGARVEEHRLPAAADRRRRHDPLPGLAERHRATRSGWRTS